MKNVKKSEANRFFPDGLTFRQIGNEIRVFSQKLQADPIFNRPYIKVRSKAVPKSRPSINEWFEKFTPQSNF